MIWSGLVSNYFVIVTKHSKSCVIHYFQVRYRVKNIFQREKFTVHKVNYINKSDMRGYTKKWNTVCFECTTSINIKLTSTPLSPPATITPNFQNRKYFLWRSLEFNSLTIKSPWVQQKYEATGSCTCRQSLRTWVWWDSPCCVSLRYPSALSAVVVCSRSSDQTSASNDNWVKK